MEASNKNNFAADQHLAEGEEIIGVYGTKDHDGRGYFLSLGFIVWKPPK